MKTKNPDFFRPGQRVLADGKPGCVNYVRMAAPDYSSVSAVAVFLDSRPGKSAIFPIDSVEVVR